jgi:ankyrin repeat protein
MRFLKGKPLHEKILAVLLLVVISFVAFGEIYRFFSLDIAVADGHLWRTELLLKLGFNVNGSGNRIASPIYFAVSHDNVEMLGLLLSHGANMELKDSTGEAPLMHAIILNKTSAAKFLITKGAQADDCSFHWAVYEGNIELVNLLLQKGLSVNGSCVPDNVRAAAAKLYINTSLYAAIHNDNSDMVQFLIDHGAVVNAPGMKYTPLHAAAYSRAHKILKLLIKKGAKINAKDNEGHTPLFYATKKNDIDGQQILLAAGAIRE